MPSMYIFQVFYHLHKSIEQWKEKRQYLVNMKVLCMTESAITFHLLGSRLTSYCSIVLEKLHSEYFKFKQCNQYEGLKYGDNQGHFIIMMNKWKEKSFISGRIQ